MGQTTSEEFCAASSKCSDNSHAGSEYIDSPTADFDDVHYPFADSEDADYPHADFRYADFPKADPEIADNDHPLAQDRHRAYQPAYRRPAVWSHL